MSASMVLAAAAARRSSSLLALSPSVLAVRRRVVVVSAPALAPPPLRTAATRSSSGCGVHARVSPGATTSFTCDRSRSRFVGRHPLYALRCTGIGPAAAAAAAVRPAAAGRRRPYFTNAHRVKGDDPYAVLGLAWGASHADIKAAFRERAARVHPDVNVSGDPPAQMLRQFQALTAAYETLTAKRSTGGGSADDDTTEWRGAVWRRGRRIADARTDVAGVLRRRPIPPAATAAATRRHTALGHPAGLGAAWNHRTVRGEYLGAGAAEAAAAAPHGGSSRSSEYQTPSSVGRGRNKWVDAKPYAPWTCRSNNNSINNNNNNNSQDETPLDGN